MYGRGTKLSKPKTQRIRNTFTLKKEKRNKDRIIRDPWILFETEEEKKEIVKLEKKKKRLIKNRMIKHIRTLFEQEENYYKPKKVNNFGNNNYIEYKSNGDRNSNLSLEEYFNKIKPYLRNIIIGLQTSNTWEI